MELEFVKRRFTRLIDGIGLMPSKDRLINLKLTTLTERRARGDIIEVFKIFRGICKFGKNLFIFPRSGMNIVVNKDTDAINTFQMIVVGYCNKIPDSLEMVEDVNEFKSL